jgi:radical SAM protein with 4Fe4S-binding SPASM domain
MSKFVITIEINKNDILLFSTLTTAIIVLNKKTYQGIFENNDFSLYSEEVNELLSANLLIPSDFDENKYLSDIRLDTMKRANDIPASYYMITPTMNCNARCYYCFEKDAHHENMTMETAKAIVDYILKHKSDGIITIHWFGGEPLLSIDIISFISKQLKLNNISFDSKITTNGYLLDEKTSYRAKNEWRVEVIQVTIDAIGDEYNRIKNYKDFKNNPFDIVISNIHNAVKNNINIRLRININPNEIEQVKKTISFLKTEFGKYDNVAVYFAPIDSSSDNIPSIANSFTDSLEHPIITLLEYEENYATLGFSPQTALCEEDTIKILSKYYLDPIPMSCAGVCSNSLTIDSLGDFYVCHRLLGWGSNYSCGNVRDGFKENKITDYYRSSELNSIECNSCNLLPTCQGGCKFRAWKYRNKKNSACSPIKGIAEKMLLKALKELGVDL